MVFPFYMAFWAVFLSIPSRSDVSTVAKALLTYQLHFYSEILHHEHSIYERISDPLETK